MVYLKIVNGIEFGKDTTHILPMQKRHSPSIPCTPPLYYEYGFVDEDEQYHYVKQDISSEKQKDMYTLRNFCKGLEFEELEWWYPKPGEEEGRDIQAAEEEDLKQF